MLQTTAPVLLRHMTEHDLPLLHRWLNEPHVVRWWGGERPTFEQVGQHYLPRFLAEQNVKPYIALLEGEPLGYAQSYRAADAGGGWWMHERDPGVHGIDQFIGNPTRLGIGLGTRLVRALVDLLFSDAAVTQIQTDPAPDNLRAIRCYEKAGFRSVKTIVTPDGPAVYMLQSKPLA